MGFLRAALLFVVTGVAACGGGSTGSSGLNGPSSPSQGLLTATIDGASFVASQSSITATVASGILKIAGTDTATGSARTIELTIEGTAPGIYPIGLPAGTPVTGAVLTLGNARWIADFTMGSGSITLNAFASNRASGTFLFNAQPVTGTPAAGIRIVTEGVFTVTF